MSKFMILVLLALFPFQEKKIDQQVDFITTDPLGNLYCINDSRIIQYTSSGIKSHEYADSFLGKIHHADASDPLRILLLYSDFNQLQFVDNTLSPLGSPIDLYQYSTDEISLACTSAKGGFWIFNATQMQATHISSQGKTLTKTIILNAIMNNMTPSYMVEHHNQLFFLFPKWGLLELDDMGQMVRKIPITGIQSVQIKDNQILYVKKNHLYSFTPSSKEDSLVFPQSSLTGNHFRLEHGIIYRSQGNRIFVHQAPRH